MNSYEMNSYEMNGETTEQRFLRSVDIVSANKNFLNASIDDPTKLIIYGLYKCAKRRRGPLESDNLHIIKFKAWENAWRSSVRDGVENAMHIYADMVDILLSRYPTMMIPRKHRKVSNQYNDNSSKIKG